MPEPSKTFLLGVGAQKSGTTWISGYLGSSERVAVFQDFKEYHVWDAIHLPLCKGRLVAEKDRDLNSVTRLRFFLQQSPENYFKFFDNLMMSSSRPVTFDISPSYAGLGREVFGRIIAGFEDRGVATKALFIMRDPVERCWSNVRKTHLRRTGQVVVPDEQVVAHALSADAAFRTRYDETVAELEAAFHPDSLFLSLYEDLFQPGELTRLSSFCGVAYRPALAERRVFGTAKAQPLGDAAFRAIASHYRAVYDFAARRFPNAQQLWPGYAYL